MTQDRARSYLLMLFKRCDDLAQVRQHAQMFAMTETRPTARVYVFQDKDFQVTVDYNKMDGDDPKVSVEPR
jgi:hypothetical protein